MTGFQVHKRPLRLASKQIRPRLRFVAKLTEVPSANRGPFGLIDWLDPQSATSVSKDRHDCDEQKPRAKQEQT